MNRISYVSPQGDLFIARPDGSDAQKLAEDIQGRSTGGSLAQRFDLANFYAWPTWSPDGTKLAASRIQLSSGQAQVSVQVIDLASRRARTIFNNDPAAVNFVAQTAPHYLYWGPDSRSLAFVAATAQGLTLFVEDTEAPGAPKVVQTGGPIYFHWGRDGNAILLHIRQAVRLAHKPFAAAPAELLTDTTGFRVPALSPDGRLMAYAAAGHSGGALFIAETADPSNNKAVLEVGTLCAFGWSPDGAELAVVDQGDPESSVFDRLRLVSVEGRPARTIAQEPLIAFYWSPDGGHIAWVALDLEQRMFHWKVAPRGGTPARQLFLVQPSTEALDMLTFFDQFAYSHSPWSPDGSQLVVAGTREHLSGRRNGQTLTGDRVFVLDVAGASPPREIASGTLAFWSWN